MKLQNRRYIGRYTDPTGRVRNVRIGEDNAYSVHYYTIGDRVVEITDFEKWTPVPGPPHAFTRFKPND